MVRLAIAVEGETERQFVQRQLVQHLRPLGIETVASVLSGDVTVDRLGARMASLVWSQHAVSSLVDLYGFRRRKGRSAEELESAIYRNVTRRIKGRRRTIVVPYVQQYEFECLVFSDLKAVAHVVGISTAQVNQLEKIRSKFATPESINDGSQSAPSKRLLKVIPRYNKVIHGSAIIRRTKIKNITRICPRFSAWIAQLESISGSTSDYVTSQ